MRCHEVLKGSGRASAIIYYEDLSSEVRCLEEAYEACEMMKGDEVLLVLLVTSKGEVFKVSRRHNGEVVSRSLGKALESLVFPGADPLKIRALGELVPLGSMHSIVCGEGGQP